MLAYGANTHLPYMTKRCPESYYLGTAKLKEYQMVFRVHADIELCFDSEVTGALWRVSENDLDTLDALEGVPIYYIRHMVWVRPNNNIIPAKELYPNGMIKCWVYQMVQKIGHYHPTAQFVVTVYSHRREFLSHRYRNIRACKPLGSCGTGIEHSVKCDKFGTLARPDVRDFPGRK